MIDASVLEEYSIRRNNLVSDEDLEYKCDNNPSIYSSIDQNKELLNWEYPRKIIRSDKENELIFYWSENDKQLFCIENGYSIELENQYRNFNRRKDAIIAQIKPINWCEAYFSNYGTCIMFISEDKELYFSKNGTNRKLDIKGIKSIIRLIPLKEGIILMGFDGEDKSNVIHKVILGHPLEQPVNILLEEENFSPGSSNKRINNHLILIWGSEKYPFLMAYNKTKKTHCIFIYEYSLSTFSISFKIRSFWEEEIDNKLNTFAETVFISRTLLEENYIIVYHIPSICELRLLNIPFEVFQNICNKKTDNFKMNQVFTLNIIKDIKSVVPLDCGYEKVSYHSLRVGSLFGFNFQKSKKIFDEYRMEDIPLFLLVLLKSGKLSLYAGSLVILNVHIKFRNIAKFEVLEVSSSVSNNFDVLIRYSENENKQNSILGARCSLRLLPNDLLVQILMKLLFKISNLEFSAYLLREIFKCDPQMQWRTLCDIILKDIQTNDNKSINEKMNINNIDQSVDSPMSSGICKKIKLFLDKNEDNFTRKTSNWSQIVSFWTKYINDYGKSPFDRKEFSNLISKRIIPHEFLKKKMSNNTSEARNSSAFTLKITNKIMFILHGLFEEFNLCPLFDTNGDSIDRLKRDILIPISKNLGLYYYYEYYQLLDCTFNFKDKVFEQNKYLKDYDLPPILLDKILTLSKYSKLNKNDFYYEMIQKYFPLQLFTLSLFELLMQRVDQNKILDFICSTGINNNILPILNPIISFAIEKFLRNYSNLGPPLDLEDEKYILLDRFDLLSSAKNLDNFHVISNPSSNKTHISDNLAASVLPHGRNTVDDQKSMLENLQIYYKEKMDPSRIITCEKETILEKWKNNLFEYSNMSSSELSFNWCFQIFSFDTRFCNTLELLSLQSPPHILLQRSSGAYPIDEESWDEFQRQRISDAVQLVFTSFLGRIACTLGGSFFDIFLKNLDRPKFVNKVYEVASNSLINVDNERFKEFCLDISIWNDFYAGILEALKFRQPDVAVLKSTFDSYKKNWLFDQMKKFSSSDDVPFQSGFLFGLSISGFLNNNSSNPPTSFPLILEPNEIYNILENDGQSIKTCAILLGTAIAALRTQNKVLLRLYLMHIPSILPNIYTKSLQISNISQYSAILSIGLLFAQSRSRQIIEILLSEFLRSISELDDQASINPSMYSVCAGIALGMVIQKKNQYDNENSDIKHIEDHITSILLSCISGNKILKFLSNLASGPNLEHYTDYSGLKKFKNNDLLRFIQNEDTERENRLKLNSTHTSNHANFSNSSKNYCSKIVDSTILGIPATISLSIMHMRSKNISISNLIPIPYDKPEELVNHRPETLIFMSMCKTVIEWKDDCVPNKEFICKQIPTYLWYLPTDKTFPFPIFDEKLIELNSGPSLDNKLLHYVSIGTLDWIHCIQARLAILSGIIWGLGIVFAGRRSRELKKIINLILKYLDGIPLIQMPLCIASTIRDKSICSSQITIDRWSRDLCIRVCLTSASICFSGSGDKHILTQIKYFRAKLLESAQLLWTSSTAISPYSIFSIPPIEHVYSQLMAYNNALGFLFLSAGHVSFNNNEKLISTFLMFATHPIYPKDASDISTPGIIFQPLRFLFIIAAKYGRKAVIPKLIRKTPDSLNYDHQSQGVISKDIINYVPICVEMKSHTNMKNEMEYYVLPAILPDWNQIKSIKVLGNNYCSLNINLESNKPNPYIKKLFEGHLWIQLKKGYTVYNWNEANYIIKMSKSKIYPLSESIHFHDEISIKKQMLCKYFGKFICDLREGIEAHLTQNQEINNLYDNFSHTLVLKDESNVFKNKMNLRNAQNSNITLRKKDSTLLNYCIENIVSNFFQLTQDENHHFNSLISPDLIKVLRVMLSLEPDKKIQKLLFNIHQKFCVHMSIIIRCIRFYYGQGGTRILSCDERRSLRLFLALHGMPQTIRFNDVVNKIQTNQKINSLLKENYTKYEEIIAIILSSEFPTLSSFGLKILKIIIGESYYKVQKTSSQDSDVQQDIKSKFAHMFTSKNYP